MRDALNITAAGAALFSLWWLACGALTALVVRDTLRRKRRRLRGLHCRAGSPNDYVVCS